MKVRITGLDALTPAMQRAVRDEARREILRQRELFDADFDAMALMVLHRRFGFGPKRLRRFYDEFIEYYEEMRAFYNGEDADGKIINDDTAIFKCRAELLKIGVDVLQWNAAISRKRKG